ncbi:MAG: VCBS repeat-containing protein [Abitibacteriaceae bacterium]|nr:VCBS repeat-containing protein [Abditibacteriaceae bacterium]
MKQQKVKWLRGSITATISYGLLLLGCSGCNQQKGVDNNQTKPAQVPLNQGGMTQMTGEATKAQVAQICGACHANPSPDTFPRSRWKAQVAMGYKFFFESNLQFDAAPEAAVVKYFENRAPEAIATLTNTDATGKMPVQFQRIGYPEPGNLPIPSITNVNLVHLYSKTKLDLLACDMRYGYVMVMKPYEKSPQFRVLAKLTAPAHTQVADLDGDGIQDIIVADLGIFWPSDERKGRVIWLKGHADGTFTPYTLLSHVGRVADVEMADFNGDGKQDLVVAEFGHHKVGSVTLLENATTDWRHPIFHPHILDNRTGAIHVPVCDLNGDGKPDFVALISQEHETVVAFLNQGKGQFIKKTIFAGAHPALGSSGIQLVDFNHDGKLDVLYTAGDNMDPHSILRADQGVYWLENQGTYPFKAHFLNAMYGTYRAVAADVDHDGLMDIFAVTFLPAPVFPQRKPLNLDSVVLLKQSAPGKFDRYALEKVSCDHPTCVAGDIYGDGKIDLVIGNINTSKSPMHDAVTIWRNIGQAHLLAARPASNAPTLHAQ